MADEKKEPADKPVDKPVVLEKSVPKYDFTVVGVAGGIVNVRGAGFGTARGQMTVGGYGVPLSSWQDTVIKGLLPFGVKGEVVVTTASGAKQKGVLP